MKAFRLRYAIHYVIPKHEEKERKRKKKDFDQYYKVPISVFITRCLTNLRIFTFELICLVVVIFPSSESTHRQIEKKIKNMYVGNKGKNQIVN